MSIEVIRDRAHKMRHVVHVRQHAFSVDATLSHDFAQRHLPPELLDGERADEEHHARSHE